jgi:hypothetical protein
MRLEEFDLKQDPFPIVPDGPVHNWAGRKDLKLDLEDITKGVRARDIGITEFIIIHGELGAGKSHALKYLRTLINSNPNDYNALAVYIERPRVASKLNFLELARYIVKAIGRERVRLYCAQMHRLVEEIAEELAQAAGMGNIQNKASFAEQALDSFTADDKNMIKVMLRSSENDGKLFEFLIGQDKCGGEEYEGKIDSDFLAAKVLADFFRVITSVFGENRRILDAVYLFIDECEVLADAKASESELVFTGFRELINGLPYRFGLMLSFSAATALIEAVMPQHLLKRLTRPYIEVPMLDDQQAVDFLLAQMDFYRTDGSPHRGDFYPFSREAIDFIVGNTTTLTPRNLFIECKRVLERAIRRHDLQRGQSIPRETAEAILRGYR